MMIAENPDTIMEIIEDFANEKGEEEEVKIDIDEKVYKAKIEYARNNVDIRIKIFRVGDGDLFCVEFVKKNGVIMEFLNTVEEIKEHINKKFGYLDQEDDEDEQN